MANPSSLLHPSKLRTPRTPANSFPNLGFKLAFFVVFVALLPLSPSRAPEFVGESISAGIWEFFHLLVVGIAISYGLFSRRNVDVHAHGEKEMPHKSPRAASIASQIPNVPSIFDDDEIDSHLGTPEESGPRMRGSAYFRNEPSSVVVNGSNDIALPSPVPWRSRSGKLEMEAKPGLRAPTRWYSLPTAFEADKVFSSSPLSSSPAAITPTTWHAHKSNKFNLSNPPPAPPPANLGNGYQSTSETSRSMKYELKDLGGSGRGREGIVVDPLVSPSMPSNSFESNKFNSRNPPPAPPLTNIGNGYQSTSGTSRSTKDELKDLGGRCRGKEEIAVDPLASPWRPRNSFENPSLGKTVRPRVEQTLYFDPPQSPSVPKRNAFLENTISTSDDSDNTDESVENFVKNVSSSAAPGAGALENEVDRKADEFIAKFREQIRQQRIESIKRSTKLHSIKQQQYKHSVSEI